LISPAAALRTLCRASTILEARLKLPSYRVETLNTDDFIVTRRTIGAHLWKRAAHKRLSVQSNHAVGCWLLL